MRPFPTHGFSGAGGESEDVAECTRSGLKMDDDDRDGRDSVALSHPQVGCWRWRVEL